MSCFELTHDTSKTDEVFPERSDVGDDTLAIPTFGNSVLNRYRTSN